MARYENDKTHRRDKEAHRRAGDDVVGIFEAHDAAGGVDDRRDIHESSHRDGAIGIARAEAVGGIRIVEFVRIGARLELGRAGGDGD